ncbi:MAG: nucleoside deaminase [Candidatus Dormibacteria bacterium]
MARALGLARAAGRRGEVPVGALAVQHGRVVAGASNRVERLGDSSAHAELLVLGRAARRLGTWRLVGVTLYTTLEPCPMCAGAALLARLERLVYGADDPLKGAFRSVYDVLGHPAGNHHPQVVGGCLAADSSALLRSFFARLRDDPHPPTGLANDLC